MRPDPLQCSAPPPSGARGLLVYWPVRVNASLPARIVPIMEPVVEGALQTPDGYWLVEIVRYKTGQRWYRVSHAGVVVAEKSPISTVQRILGDDFSALQPVEADTGGTGIA